MKNLPYESAILERTGLRILFRIVFYLLINILPCAKRSVSSVWFLDIISGGYVGLRLEYIAFFVFELDSTVSLVLNKLAYNFRATWHGEFAPLTTSLIFEPFPFKVVAVGIVHSADTFSHVFFHVTFVEFAITEKYLDVTVLQTPSFEASFQDLVLSTEKNALTLRPSLTPLTFINRSACELAETGAMAQVILPVAFVDVAIDHDHLPLAMFEAFGYAAIVNLTRHLL